MLIGMDVGGTNTDLAMVDEEIRSVKIPNTRGMKEALGQVRSCGRLAVSTSTPLNTVLAGSPARVKAIVIPGPGLCRPGGIRGAVNHRGDIVEEIDPVEVEERLVSSPGDVIAIAGKFSVRNPALEKEAAALALRYYAEERIATSHHLAGLGFPARIATTRLNAAMKEPVFRLVGDIRAEKRDFLFFKGDGGLTLPDDAVDNPSVLYHSSAAAVALGAYFLSGQADCTVVDVGGTTTDLVPLVGGMPLMEVLVHQGERTVTRAVHAVSLPFGGDSLVGGNGLEPVRAGNSLAFGGGSPTLTDALNVTGEEIGDREASALLAADRAAGALEFYISQVSRMVGDSGARRLVGTGYLAPYLVPEIARRAGARFTIPPHWECANAVGVAVSRVSLTLHARFDSGRGIVVFNGEQQPLGKMGDDDAVIGRCREEVRRRAIAAGANPGDLGVIEVLYYHGYDVIRGSFSHSRIADVVVQVAPGVTVEAL